MNLESSIKFVKEFLTPNLGKIILTIGFGLAAYYFGINWCDGSGGSAMYGWGSLQPSVCWAYYSPIYWGPVSLVSSYAYEMSAQLSIVRLIIGIIYWYLIASVIMYIYGVIKNEFIRKNKSQN